LLLLLLVVVVVDIVITVSYMCRIVPRIVPRIVRSSYSIEHKVVVLAHISSARKTSAVTVAVEYNKLAVGKVVCNRNLLPRVC
jgi:hypothetical protein